MVDRPVDANAAVFCLEKVVHEDAIDRNGHVNNVVFVQWMQDAAVAHSAVTGGTEEAGKSGASWVVRAHRVEYLRPAFAGDRIVVRTWVSDFRRVRSMRRYEFRDATTSRLLVRGETEWVFVDARSGRPLTIPESVQSCFVLYPFERLPTQTDL